MMRPSRSINAPPLTAGVGTAMREKRHSIHCIQAPHYRPSPPGEKARPERVWNNGHDDPGRETRAGGLYLSGISVSATTTVWLSAGAVTGNLGESPPGPTSMKYSKSARIASGGNVTR